ncbi:MAG: swr complex subunit [Bathelium mastoideum]|nr:MAG: swr complex subunit [Bathelium mastoideum]KAI9690389.1 MAG: swr complex subunit [Bathelium mastoideum]
MATDIMMEDADYVSEDDEDFNPSAAADGAGLDSSDDEAYNEPAKASKRGALGRTDSELDFENSGDEATIQSAKARRKQKSKKRRGKKLAKDGNDESSIDIDLNDEDGGEGGLVKTRAQRKAEKAEQRPLAGTEGSTADVDAIWARLMSAPLKPAPGIDEIEKDAITSNDVPKLGEKGQTTAQINQKPDPTRPQQGTTQGSQISSTTEDDTITIKRTYDFAGETHTEEKRVAKDSAEARLFLSSVDPTKNLSPEAEQSSDPSKPLLRKPLKRPSRFEPNPAGEIRNLPPHAKLPRALHPISNLKANNDRSAAAAAAMNSNLKAQKLNTVTKSKLDWAGYVDKEGIANELQEYEKGGKTYLDRMDFLGRVEERRDAEARMARGAAPG